MDQGRRNGADEKPSILKYVLRIKAVIFPDGTMSGKKEIREIPKFGTWAPEEIECTNETGKTTGGLEGRSRV